MKFIRIITVLSFLILVLSGSLVQAQNLEINEVCASNVSLISDEDGEFGDWIELYHAGSAPLSLKGYGLSDDSLSPLKWTLPDTILNPGDFLLIWASSKERKWHTTFKIKSTGEHVLLSNPTGNLISEVAMPEVAPDLSFGRYPDGNGEWNIMAKPTPSHPNSDSLYADLSLVPVFSMPEGFYSDSVIISLSSSSVTDSIFYTLDGTVPTMVSNLYKDSLILDSTTTLRARSFSRGLTTGGIGTKTFFINENSTFSTISLTTDPYNLFDPDSGIFVFWSPYCESNLFQDWERPIHIQFFDESQNHGFSMDAGVKVHGGLTRNVPGKSLAIMARSAYGTSKINYHVFEDKELNEFNNLVLRNSGNDYRWTMFRDCFMQSLIQDELDLDLSASRPAVVHLNGSYWGIRNIREKMNEHFLAGNYKISPEKTDVLEYKHHNSEVQVLHGSAEDYNQLIDFISGNDLTEPEPYSFVASQINIHNYIEYLIAQIYFDNSDWPGNNIKWWRRSDPVGKWRWLLFDTDFGFGLSPFRNETGIELEHYKHNTLQIALATNGEEWPNPPHSTFLLRNLLKNLEFKHQFINTFCDHLNSTFKPERILPILTRYENLYAPEIERHQELNYSTGDWPGDVEVLKTFAKERLPYIFMHLATHFGLRKGTDLSVDVSDSGTGKIGVNSIICKEYPWSGTYLSNVPVKVRAIPLPGYKFSGWSDGNESIIRSIKVGDVSSLTAYFEAATFDPQDIMIHEINYISSTDFDTDDWIELYNHSEATANLSGWVFKDSRDDHSFMIPDNTIIEPRGTLVLCRKLQSFKLLRSDLQNVTGNTDFGLSANGELLRLFDPEGKLIDYVQYGTDTPWPKLTAKEGLTIALLDPGLDNTLASSWSVSEEQGGSPGILNWNQLSSGQAVSKAQIHKLGQNYPNPFRTQTTIYYSIRADTRANIQVYNLSGQLVTTLVDRMHTQGNYTCTWNGTNSRGVKVSEGIYLYRISTDDHQETKRMILMK